ncbi:MAG: ATP-grasp domain-containing protein [Deltaproteobacteria bacterium]|nr:ATP-grasp domain-containing protein [Deltaproteobacteria bacterium]
MQQAIAVVDPFFSGAVFNHTVKKMGHDFLVIQSNKNFDLPAIDHNKERHLVFDNNTQKILATCRALNVVALFAGNENGVLLADSLSEKLGLVTNGTKLSLARRHKGHMRDVFNRHDVPSPKHSTLKNPDKTDVLKAVTQMDLKYPVIIKTAMGFGTLCVYRCQSDTEIEMALSGITQQDLTPFGIEGDDVVVEEYLEGTEYAVNMFGDGKKTRVTDIWKYEKIALNGRHNIYKSITLMAPHTKISRVVADIAGRAVEALGIKYGPSHTEVMVTRAGPKIIEVGARLSGGHLIELARRSGGYDVVRATIDVFKGSRPVLKKQHSQKFATTAELYTEKKGVVKKIHGLKTIRRLPSFHQWHLGIKKGRAVEPTTSLVNSPGHVLLVHSSKERLKRDRNRCHQVFKLEVAP